VRDSRKTPETSEYTGAKDRIDDLGEAKRIQAAQYARFGSGVSVGQERLDAGPIEIDENSGCGRPCLEGLRGERKVPKDFSPFGYALFWNLLDWTGPPIANRRTKVGKIPGALAPDSEPDRRWILLAGVTWVRKFGPGCSSEAAGTPERPRLKRRSAGRTGRLCTRENPLGLFSD